MGTIESWLVDVLENNPKGNRPSVSVCYAQSLDGSIAHRQGAPTKISGSETNLLTHRLRAAHDAILVGINTVLSDDPLLTVRLVEGKNPQPVIMDSLCRIPESCKLLQEHPSSIWVATTEEAPSSKRSNLEEMGAELILLPHENTGRVAIPAMVERLYHMGINSLMVEGGGSVITSFLESKLIDQIILTIAPFFMGGYHAVSENINQHNVSFPRLKSFGSQQLGEDLVVWGELESEFGYTNHN